jgi:hypothetical protein
MKHSILTPVAAAALLLGSLGASFVATPAHAQRAVVAPTAVIESMSVNADSGLSPGSTLHFTLRGTPGANRAEVALDQTNVAVVLRETSPGVYRGTYIVRRGDRIDPTRVMTGRISVAGQTLARNFSYPPAFQALAMGAAPATAAAIDRFTMRPQGRLAPGRELRFRLEGARGGDAWLDIPGVISGVDLAEVRPGVYEGTYTIRRRDDLDAFDRAVATLRHGQQRVTAQLGDRDARPGGRDSTPPVISDMWPAHNDRVRDRERDRISARVVDEGSGVDEASIRLRIDGRDVSRNVRFEENEVRFREYLPPGRHDAELTVRDRAGNVTTKAWRFEIGERDRDQRSGVGLPLQLTSHQNNAVIDDSGRLVLSGRTAPGADVRIQVASIATVGGLIGVSQPMMDQTIRADANGFFSIAVAPHGSGWSLPGSRVEVTMTATSGTQTAEERVTLHRRG